MSRRPRILFVGEAVTLAHVARPLALASSLDPERYDVHFACDQRSKSHLGAPPGTFWPVDSISSRAFLEALARGRPVYRRETLEAYVREDRRLLKKVAPDWVIGDFRLSLSISARIEGVPYANLTNAHWSPYAPPRAAPVPELPFVRWLGLRASRVLVASTEPWISSLHAKPLDEVRKAYGLAPLCHARATYTDGDETFYCDLPSIASAPGAPPHHRYLGPILWSPEVPLPVWWDQTSARRPLVYVTLGSSGQTRCLPDVLRALSTVASAVVVATAARFRPVDLPSNVWCADFLPGMAVAQASDLVVCSGGSATAYQALMSGVPVLGIPSNMDQHMTMRGIAERGAGTLLRVEEANVRSVASAARSLLETPSYREQAQAVAFEGRRYDAKQRFADLCEGRFQQAAYQSTIRRHERTREVG